MLLHDSLGQTTNYVPVVCCVVLFGKLPKIGRFASIKHFCNLRGESVLQLSYPGSLFTKAPERFIDCKGKRVTWGRIKKKEQFMGDFIIATLEYICRGVTRLKLLWTGIGQKNPGTN